MKTTENPHAKVYTEEEKLSWQLERAKLAEDIAKWSKPSKHKRDNHEALLKDDDKVVRKAVSL